MSAVEWTVESYHASGRTEAGPYDVSVTRYLPNPDGYEWRAYCAGPGQKTSLHRWFPNPEEAKTAVEKHVREARA